MDQQAIYAPRLRHFKSPYPAMFTTLALILFFVIADVLAMFGMVEILSLPSYIALVVGFLFWVYRAASNVREISRTENPSNSPAWALAWWFIPLANIWYSLQIMWELWVLSQPRGMRRRAVCWLVVVWWLTWLAATALGLHYYWSAQVYGAAELHRVYLLASGLEIAAALFLALLVWQISRQQISQVRALSGESTS